MEGRDQWSSESCQVTVFNAHNPSDANVTTVLAKSGNFPAPCIIFPKRPASNLMISAFTIGDFSGILVTDKKARIVPKWFLFQQVAKGGDRCAAVGRCSPEQSRGETLTTPRQTFSLIQEPTILSLKHK